MRLVMFFNAGPAANGEERGRVSEREEEDDKKSDGGGAAGEKNASLA